MVERISLVKVAQSLQADMPETSTADHNPKSNPTEK